MGITWWTMGIVLSLLASLFGTLGKVLMKCSHNYGDNPVILGGAAVCLFLLNPIFDALSYAYAAQSVLAPMAGFSIVWNIIFSPLILGEKTSIQDIIGTWMILSGCIIVGITGSHVTPNHSREELFLLFRQPIFVVYFFTLITIALVLLWCIIHLKRFNPYRRFAFGALSGIIGGNLFFLKASVELVEAGKEVWLYPGTYCIFLLALITSAGGIYILNAGLKEYDALYLVAVYQTFLIIIGSLSGILFFREDTGMSFVAMLIYPVGIVVTIFGILALSTTTMTIKAPPLHSDQMTLLDKTNPIVLYDQDVHGRKEFGDRDSRNVDNAI